MDEKTRLSIMKTLYDDKLREIFSKQSRFQHALGYKVETLIGDEAINYIKWNTLAIIDETMEALRETPWKPWKKTQDMNFTAYKEELVDLLHFFVNACLVAGFSADELFDSYNQKMNENIIRQINKY